MCYFATFLGPIIFLGLERNCLYRDLVVVFAPDPLEDQLGWSMEEVRWHWNWALGSGFLNSSVLAHLAAYTGRVALFRLELQSWPGRHAAVAQMKRLSTTSTTASEFTCFGITSGSGWPASNPSSWCCLTLVTSVSREEAGSVSLDTNCSQNGDLDDAKEGIVWRCILRCDRNRLDRITFDWRWVHAVSLIV